MTLRLGRKICNDFEASSQREWLVTNGIGGYASGTIAGVLTRSYHGLLIAALKPPLERTLTVSKFDETILHGSHSFPLFSNHWLNGTVEPLGFQDIEHFRLEGTTPVWAYAVADAQIEKRIWMQPGVNTTYVRYDFLQGSQPIELTIKTMVNYRDHHANTRAGDWLMQVEQVENGLRMKAFDKAAPFYILSAAAEAIPKREWYEDYYLTVEAYRGLKKIEDNYYAGDFHAELLPGECLTLVMTTEPDPNLDGISAFESRQTYDQQLISQSELSCENSEIQQLVLAADQFIVDRPSTEETQGKSIIAGYPWFSDWGRDIMIALPGLTLTTGRPEIARRILRTLSGFVNKGMIPNRFPEIGENAEYNTADATLWYFEAVRAYWETTGDLDLLKEIFPVLQDIITWHQRGTRYNIQMDPKDSLLYAGEPGVQLTWMDAKVGDWVVTPRIGKPVEINALWYNALRVMADFAEQIGKSGKEYTEIANNVSQSFSHFWNQEMDYCFDVISGPQGDDPALRPNQLLAISLSYSPLTATQQRSVVDACSQHLLTPYGLRSLAPFESSYQGHFGGGQQKRDGAYHQGTVWGWMIGPYVQAHFRVHKDPVLARSFLQSLIKQISHHGLGSISEIFDGNAPFTPRGCFAQAWSVSEVLRTWQLTNL